MTQKTRSTVPQPGRRQLLLGGSVAALAAAAGATVRSALAGEPAETPAPAAAADVRQFGAVGDGKQDGFCSHTGTTHVENCDFHIRGGTRHFGWVLKPFDASQQCVYVNNRFYCDHELEHTFGIVGTIGRTTNRDLTFSGNLVQVSFGQEPEGDNGLECSEPTRNP